MGHGTCEQILFSICFCVFLKYRPSCNLKSTWTNLDQLGVDFVQNLCQLGANLEPSCANFGSMWNQLGPTWAQFGHDLGQLGPDWPTCENLKPTWANLGQLGPTWSELVTNLGTPWANLGLASANFCQRSANLN